MFRQIASSRSASSGRTARVESFRPLRTSARRLNALAEAPWPHFFATAWGTGYLRCRCSQATELFPANEKARCGCIGLGEHGQIQGYRGSPAAEHRPIGLDIPAGRCTFDLFKVAVGHHCGARRSALATIYPGHLFLVLPWPPADRTPPLPCRLSNRTFRRCRQSPWPRALTIGPVEHPRPCPFR